MAEEPATPSGPVFSRESVEFGRAMAFTDGLFAIAMTLLIVAVAVPTLSQEDSVNELADALGDLLPDFISFVISFLVIGRYWLAHHQLVSLLDRMDRGFLGLNGLYLMFIAFLPFPSALLGEYFDNPLSVIVYATNMAIISSMEVVLARHAYRNRLFRDQPSPEVYRFGVMMSLSPVVFFIVSIPFAFVSTSLAVGIWFLGIPFGILANRWKPDGADELLLS